MAEPEICAHPPDLSAFARASLETIGIDRLENEELIEALEKGAHGKVNMSSTIRKLGAERSPLFWRKIRIREEPRPF